MSYAIRFLYSNDKMKLFSTTSGSWFTVDRKNGVLSFISEQEAIEKVYTSVKDMDLTCTIMNGGNMGSEDEYNQMLALVISQLIPGDAAKVLSKLPEDVQSLEVSKRLHPFWNRLIFPQGIQF